MPETILLPVGRLVEGSLYRAQTTDMDGKPLTFKNGPNAGQPRKNWFFAVAIPKGVEGDWRQTSWGKQIFAFATTAMAREIGRAHV